MNAEIINAEVQSPALKSIITSLVDVVDRTQSGNTDYRQANVEIAGHKHVIQSIALDWATSKIRQAKLALPKKRK